MLKLGSRRIHPPHNKFFFFIVGALVAVSVYILPHWLLAIMSVVGIAITKEWINILQPMHYRYIKLSNIVLMISGGILIVSFISYTSWKYGWFAIIK